MNIKKTRDSQYVDIKLTSEKVFHDKELDIAKIIQNMIDINVNLYQ